jgi:hypothetical protein
MAKLSSKELIENTNRKIDRRMMVEYKTRGHVIHESKNRMHFGVRVDRNESPVISFVRNLIKVEE